jgi:hypothetical protein
MVLKVLFNGSFNVRISIPRAIASLVPVSLLVSKDYEEIVEKCCDAWNDILKKDKLQIKV